MQLLGYEGCSKQQLLARNPIRSLQTLATMRLPKSLPPNVDKFDDLT